MRYHISLGKLYLLTSICKLEDLIRRFRSYLCHIYTRKDIVTARNIQFRRQVDLVFHDTFIKDRDAEVNVH